MGKEKKVIFVVEDERIIAQTLTLILERSGFTAFAFLNPRDALIAAQSGPPDLLLSDVVMPENSGIELAIQFGQTHPQCKILLLSGQTVTASMLEDARDRGYEFEVLAKPVHPKDLLAKLRGCSHSAGEGQLAGGLSG